MKRTAALAVLALALFTVTNVRHYVDAPDSTEDALVRHGLVVIVPSHDLCYGVEVEQGEPTLSGWTVRHVDTFGGPCE